MDGEGTPRRRDARPIAARFADARRAFATLAPRLDAWGRDWLSPSVQRRLSFVNRRGETVDHVRRMSRLVLVWPLLATALSIVAVVAARNAGWVLVGLAALYGLGTWFRGPPTKRKLGETASELAARSRRRRQARTIAVTALLLVAVMILHGWSPVGAQLLAMLAILAHAAYRCALWHLDLFVLSTTAIWRFQGLINFQVSSLEYSKIQAGPNATSGLAAWLPIGTIEMDSAAQTGDLPMQRIGPVWGAEDLAVAIFERRKRSGQRVRIIEVQEQQQHRTSRYPGAK